MLLLSGVSDGGAVLALAENEPYIVDSTADVALSGTLATELDGVTLEWGTAFGSISNLGHAVVPYTRTDGSTPGLGFWTNDGLLILADPAAGVPVAGHSGYCGGYDAGDGPAGSLRYFERRGRGPFIGSSSATTIRGFTWAGPSRARLAWHRVRWPERAVARGDRPAIAKERVGRVYAGAPRHAPERASRPRTQEVNIMAKTLASYPTSFRFARVMALLAIALFALSCGGCPQPGGDTGGGDTGGR